MLICLYIFDFYLPSGPYVFVHSSVYSRLWILDWIDSLEHDWMQQTPEVGQCVQ